MLKRLQQKWGVTTPQFIAILCVFAITGTATAWITRAITAWVGFTAETFWLWRLLLRLAMLIFGYQAILLLVAFLFGQFPFFWKYEKKILKRLGVKVEENHHKSQITNLKSQISNLPPATFHYSCHYLIYRKGNALFRKIIPVNKPECFRFSRLLIYLHLPFVKIEGF